MKNVSTRHSLKNYSLADCPDEILFLILNWLSPTALDQLCLTSMRLRDIAKNDRLWKPFLEINLFQSSYQYFAHRYPQHIRDEVFLNDSNYSTVLELVTKTNNIELAAAKLVTKVLNSFIERRIIFNEKTLFYSKILESQQAKIYLNQIVKKNLHGVIFVCSHFDLFSFLMSSEKGNMTDIACQSRTINAILSAHFGEESSYIKNQRAVLDELLENDFIRETSIVLYTQFFIKQLPLAGYNQLKNIWIQKDQNASLYELLDLTPSAVKNKDIRNHLLKISAQENFVTALTEAIVSNRLNTLVLLSEPKLKKIAFENDTLFTALAKTDIQSALLLLMFFCDSNFNQNLAILSKKENPLVFLKRICTTHHLHKFATLLSEVKYHHSTSTYVVHALTWCTIKQLAYRLYIQLAQQRKTVEISQNTEEKRLIL